MSRRETVLNSDCKLHGWLLAQGEVDLLRRKGKRREEKGGLRVTAGNERGGDQGWAVKG